MSDLLRTATKVVKENAAREPGGSTAFANAFLVTIFEKVAALEAELQRVKFSGYNELRHRAEQAEAALAVEKDRHMQLKADVADAVRLMEQAEAEVERLRNRRCEGCRWYEPGAMDPASCAVLQGFVPHNDFSCSDWTARKEAGDE
jgi:hypothetical protein